MDQYAVAPSPIGDVYVAFRRDRRYVRRACADHDSIRGVVLRAIRPPGPTREVGTEGDRARSSSAAAIRPSQMNSTYDLSSLSDFDRRALEATLRIPRGETRSYGQIAADIGSPRAHRAVGAALSRNPVPLLIPCHRVIRADGSIGEYGMTGPAAKRLLLDRDARYASAAKRMDGSSLAAATSDEIPPNPLPSTYDFAAKGQHPHMQELRERLTSLRDRIAHVMVRL